MCGIIGLVSKEEIKSSEVLKALKRLEYRGYDSYGIATDSGLIRKAVGEVNTDVDGECNIAISHCRWATHGGVTDENAHPHSCCNDEIFIVHNGIIDNYKEIKTELESLGHVFTSQTDSEVIAHFFEEELKQNSIKNAVENFFNNARGEFAVLLMKKEDKNIYAFKRGSPLVLGLTDGVHIIASDIYAFTNKTDKAIFFDENEFAIVSESGYEFYRHDSFLRPITKKVHVLDWSCDDADEKTFDHYMIKEIHEEPKVARRLIQSLKGVQSIKLQELKKMIQASSRVVFVAGGTSYHASLIGVDFLNKAGIEAHTIIASEFRNFTLLDEKTLVIPISQSGETMDVIEALRGIKAKGVKIASIVNVPYSTVQRMSNLSINIEAGQEICVAATKSFINQVITLLYLASMFGYNSDIEKIPEEILSVFDKEEKIRHIAKTMKDKKDVYIIGRDFSYPIAREIALKLKEISYIHAEGMMAGELKHGTIALIEKGVPVISLMPRDDQHIISSTKEVEARGADIIAISNNSPDSYNTISIDAESAASFSIQAAVVGQLLTYYIAKELGLPIDKPRNLAKSVTVK